MAWKIEKQANGKWAVYSTRLGDYVVIDAEGEEVERLYADKGLRVYLASARMQLARQAPVTPEGEEKIEASRRRGSPPAEDPDAPIGATGLTFRDLEEE